MFHVLVVDNDVAYRNLLREALEICGCSVTTASQGIEAAERFMNEQDIKLVLSDLNMGECGQDGNDLFFTIRDELSQRSARFALITGSVRNPVIDELARCGALIITKPFDLAQIEMLIAH